jgi:hypothetical protein
MPETKLLNARARWCRKASTGHGQLVFHQREPHQVQAKIGRASSGGPRPCQFRWAAVVVGLRVCRPGVVLIAGQGAGAGCRG